MCSGIISPSQEIDITTPQEKAYSGSALCKINKRITQKIDISTVPNVTNSLVSVVNPLYYHCVFNEGNGIFAVDFLLYQIPCCI